MRDLAPDFGTATRRRTAAFFRAKLITITVASMLFTVGSASAQSPADKAAAEALFDQGRASMQQRDFATACGLLERSQHIDPAVGTLLYLAECYERSGKPASAWATFREAADAADAARSAPRARTARERAARLAPLLSRLTITVDPENLQRPGLVVRRGDEPVQPALFNVPVPVDPGAYVVSAEAPGYERWSGTVTVPVRSGSATLSVPALTRAPEAQALGPGNSPSATSNAAAPTPAGSTPVEPVAVGDDGSTQRMVAYALGGVGVLGLAVGSYFGVRAISQNWDAESHCPRGYACDDAAGVTGSEDARASARGSNIAFAVGAAALVGGAVLYFTGSKPTSQSTAWSARIGPGGVVVGGAFQ